MKSGVWIFSRYRLCVAGEPHGRSLNEAAYQRLRRNQQEMALSVLYDERRRRRWWLFQDEFYWEDEGYDATAVKALILERNSQRRRRVLRAVAMMEQKDAVSDAARQVIPDSVKVFVWNRDGGRCVSCGGGERLEFDHVIPLALGGSNTARNLQLLCETCNRTKGASLGLA